MTQGSGLKYCEGLIYSPIRNEHGKVCYKHAAHGWCFDEGGKVIDPTWGAGLSGYFD